MKTLSKKQNMKASTYSMNNELKVGNIVVFRKIKNGEYNGVEKTLYIIIEMGLKFGELNIFDFDYGE